MTPRYYPSARLRAADLGLVLLGGLGTVLLAVLAALSIVSAPRPTMPAEQAPYVCPEDPEPVVLAADVRLLAWVATSEDPAAAEAVMWTVVNRAQASGRSLAQIATPRAYHGLRHPPRDTFLDRALRLHLVDRATRLLQGEVPDPTRGATHFHRIGTPTPPWAPAPAEWIVLGSHAFYRERR